MGHKLDVLLLNCKALTHLPFAAHPEGHALFPIVHNTSHNTYLQDTVPGPFSLAPHAALIEQCFSAANVPQIMISLEQEGSEFSGTISTCPFRFNNL